MATMKYPIQVFWSDEDGGFVALMPDLPGCKAVGDTEADAVREAHDAIDAWIKAASHEARDPGAVPRAFLQW